MPRPQSQPPQTAECGVAAHPRSPDYPEHSGHSCVIDCHERFPQFMRRCLVKIEEQIRNSNLNVRRKSVFGHSTRVGYLCFTKCKWKNPIKRVTPTTIRFNTWSLQQTNATSLNIYTRQQSVSTKWYCSSYKIRMIGSCLDETSSSREPVERRQNYLKFQLVLPGGYEEANLILQQLQRFMQPTQIHA